MVTITARNPPGRSCYLLALLAFLGSSCTEPGAGPASSGGTGVPGAPAIAPDRFVTAFRAEFPARVEAWLDATYPLVGAAREWLADPRQLELAHGPLLTQVYVDQPEPFRFSGPAGLLPAGQQVLAAVGTAPDHALKPEAFRAERVTSRVETLAMAQQALAATPPLPPLPPDARLSALWNRSGLQTSDPQAPIRFMALVAGDPAVPEALRLALAERARLYQARQQAWAALELAAADTLLRWARALRAGNVTRELSDQERARDRVRRGEKAYPDTDEELGVRARPADDDDRPETGSARFVMRKPDDFIQEKLLTALRGVQDEASATQVLQGLIPPYPQYAGLMTELKRYRQIVESGGWPSGRAARGNTKILQERLAREGYYTGELDGTFSEALQQAMLLYQQTHQLPEEKGLPSRIFWDSLGVSAADRLARIELTLQRWRETGIADDRTYVFINIADFSAEVWSEGQRLFRTKVVVGNRDTRCDEKTKRLILGYATPIQSAYITYLIFAPTWSVPPKIKREELDVEREKDPRYYEKNGFMLINPGADGEAVKQLPGPHNSLGFVKFLFPNKHATYMHDTPAKALFSLPIRPYSHGCMRLEDPIGMARTLLTLDGQWDEAKYAELFERWKELDFNPLKSKYDEEQYETLRKQSVRLEQSATLKRAIPIHIEYYTVRIDDQGRANFLADPYGYDQQRLNPTKAPRCTPDSTKAQRAFSKTVTELEKLEEQLGTLSREIRRLVRAADQLDPAEKKTARTREYAKSVEETVTQAETLAAQIRTLFDRLNTEDVPEEEWSRERMAGALKLKRMMDELRRMEKNLGKKAAELRTRVGGAAAEPTPSGNDGGREGGPAVDRKESRPAPKPVPPPADPDGRDTGEPADRGNE